jgi:tetratricopeptide (TPR) repeat protein
MSVFAETWVQFWWAVARLWLRIGLSERAANAYQRILRIRPDDAHVIFQRAWCLSDVPHRRNEAIEALRQLLQRSPYAFGSFLLGSTLQREGRDQEAVDAFEEAARLGGTRPADLYHNWGKSLAILRRREEAAEVLRQAALLQPSDVDAWRMLGSIFIELGRWKDAAACQERVMRLQPSVTHGLELGGTLYELNRLDDAERVVREALAIDSRSTDAKGLLAMVLSDQDRHSEAIELARQIRAAVPNDVPSRLVLSHVLSWAGHFEEALREATAAVEIAPTESRPYGALGSIYIRMNDGEAALRSFDRMAAYIDPAVERIPSTEWVWCYAGRGVALSLLDRHAAAMAAFEEALSIDGQILERCHPYAPHYERSRRATGQSPKGAA